MFESFRKRRDIKETIEAFGNVEPGSDHFRQVLKLRDEHNKITKGIRNKLLILSAAILVPAGGLMIANLSSDGDTGMDGIANNEKLRAENANRLLAELNELIHSFLQKNGVAEMVEDLHVTADLNGIPDSKKRDWCIEFGIPHFDGGSVTIFIPPKSDGLLVLYQVLRAIEDRLGDDVKLELEKQIGEVARDRLKEAAGPEMLSEFHKNFVEMGEDPVTLEESNFLPLLKDFATKVLAANKSLDDISLIRFMYLTSIYLKLESPNAGDVLKEPESYLNRTFLDNCRDTSVMKLELISRSTQVALSGHSEMADEIYGHSKFNNMIEKFVIPIARQLKDQAANGQEVTLAAYFMANAVPMFQFGKPEPTLREQLRGYGFFTAILNDENEEDDNFSPKHKWMVSHNLSYFNHDDSVLYISAQPQKYVPSDVRILETDIFYQLSQMTGRKGPLKVDYYESFRKPGDGKFLLTVKSDSPDMRVDYSQKVKIHVLDLLNLRKKSGDLGFRTDVKEVVDIKVKVAEALVYRLLLNYLEISTPLRKDSNPHSQAVINALERILNSPQEWIKISPEEIEGHEYFRE